jgi:hypothetical protein
MYYNDAARLYAGVAARLEHSGLACTAFLCLAGRLESHLSLGSLALLLILAPLLLPILAPAPAAAHLALFIAAAAAAAAAVAAERSGCGGTG